MNNLAPAAAASAATSTTPPTAIQPSAIPYRTTSSVSTGSIAGAVVITAFVLIALVGCLIYARRRGWVMGVMPGKRTAADADLAIVATKRLSVATVGHVVAYRGNEYLIVESAKGYHATILPMHVIGKATDDAP